MRPNKEKVSNPVPEGYKHSIKGPNNTRLYRAERLSTLLIATLFLLEINECDVNPCLNHGTCDDRINDFICYCPSGFTGKICESGRYSNPIGGFSKHRLKGELSAQPNIFGGNEWRSVCKH